MNGPIKEALDVNPNVVCQIRKMSMLHVFITKKIAMSPFDILKMALSHFIDDFQLHVAC